MKTTHTPLWLLLCMVLTGCQTLQGERDGDTYYSPAGAYAIDLSVNTFRGQVALEESCHPHAGSTTFWDGSGRMFRVDYHQAEGNPELTVPRFASDLTLFNLVLNNYLRDRIAPAPMVTSVEAAHREFLQDADPRALFAIVSLDVDASREHSENAVSGTHYYGFLLFKRGEFIYVVQHRQPVLMPEKMKAVLLRLADAMEIPGRTRSETDLERLRRVLARMAPGGSREPVRLCNAS